jgi:hypothetical protein
VGRGSTDRISILRLSCNTSLRFLHRRVTGPGGAPARRASKFQLPRPTVAFRGAYVIPLTWAWLYPVGRSLGSQPLSSSIPELVGGGHNVHCPRIHLRVNSRRGYLGLAQVTHVIALKKTASSPQNQELEETDHLRGSSTSSTDNSGSPEIGGPDFLRR